MTGENRIENAMEELARAEQCLKQAQMLRDGGFFDGAVARAYYAVFHAARAVLFSAGIEVRSHRGIVGLLGEHFVKTGHLSAEISRIVSRMQRDREDADYVIGAVFTAAQADESLANAQRFLNEARRLAGPPPGAHD